MNLTAGGQVSVDNGSYLGCNPGSVCAVTSLAAVRGSLRPATFTSAMAAMPAEPLSQRRRKSHQRKPSQRGRTTGNLYLGYAALSVGSGTVTGGMSLLHAWGTLYVGNSGSGTSTSPTAEASWSANIRHAAVDTYVGFDPGATAQSPSMPAVERCQ